MRQSGCSRAPCPIPRARAPIPSLAAASAHPASHDQRSTADSQRPKCCFPATTRESSSGGATRHAGSRRKRPPAKRTPRTPRGGTTRADLSEARANPDGSSHPMLSSINPATGETLRSYPTLSDSELDERLARAAAAYEHHRRTRMPERAQAMRRAADILEREQRELGRLMTCEMGKPLRSGADEAAKCARACRYHAEHAAEFLADEAIRTEAAQSFVRYQPLGVVLAIMPWNFPFWQVFRFAAPALMAGNVGLLKHASNVPQCALAIEDVLRRAGFDHDEFQTLLIGSDLVERVIADRRVAAVTLTGSESAGRAVAAAAGKAIKKTVLELGGSDPFIVMPSARLDDAVQTAVRARVVNSGQSCIAAKRFFAAEAVAKEFTERFVTGMQKLQIGDPMLPTTDIGPLATPQIAADLDNQHSDLDEGGTRA